jgi:hypothetical protein
VTAAGPLVVEAPGVGRAYDVLGTGELLLPSVTNVIDTVLSKPAIGFWRGKMVAGYAFEQAAWLAAKAREVAALQTAGRLDAEALQARTIAWLKRAPDRRSDHAKERGSGVHQLVEAEVLGLLAALPFARSGDRTLTGPIRTPEELTA